MLWLCFYFKQLPIEVFAQSQDRDKPRAIKSQHKVSLCNDAARTRGLSTGLSLTTAWALCPELVLHEQSSALESTALEKVAEPLLQYSPEVYLLPPYQVAVNLTGCLQVHNGWEALIKKLTIDPTLKAHKYNLGASNTLEAARLFSQQEQNSSLDTISNGLLELSRNQQLLEQLSISCLNFDNSVINRLNNTGTDTIAQLKALPKHALNRRQGIAFEQYLAELFATKPHQNQPYTSKLSFKESLSSVFSTRDLDNLSPGLLELCQRLQLFLRRHQLKATQLAWLFKHHQGYKHRLLLGVEHSDGLPNTLCKLTLLKLEKSPLKRAVNSITLVASHQAIQQDIAEDLFPESLSAQMDYSLLEKLNARLGENRVSHIQYSKTNIPEQLSVSATSGAPGLRPTLLNKHPKPLFTKGNAILLDGQPLNIIQGPERIDTQWWRQHCQRDYYIAQTPKGNLHWIYRDLKHQRWFLHGSFA